MVATLPYGEIPPLCGRKLLICGLPGSGKTTLSKIIAERISAVHLNADEIRQNINRDLGFSFEDRIEHARRMGWLCDLIIQSKTPVIADFVCPTPETRMAFGPAFVVWCDRIQKGRYEDTNRLFVPPLVHNVRVLGDGTPDYWAGKVITELRREFLEPAEC